LRACRPGAFQRRPVNQLATTREAVSSLWCKSGYLYEIN
jgi:hypothetical protein